MSASEICTISSSREIACGFSSFRHHQRAARGQFLDLGDILRPLHEGDGHPIDAGVEPCRKIGPVLIGDRGDGYFGVRQAHALAVRYLAPDIDDRNGALTINLADMKPHLAIIDQDGVVSVSTPAGSRDAEAKHGFDRPARGPNRK